MNMTDPIADMLTRIRNGVRSKLPKVDIPNSKVKTQIARILHRLRFSLQYPAKRLSKADDGAEAQWRTQELLQIKKRPKRNGA